MTSAGMKQIAKFSLLLMVLTFLSKLLGFVREIFIAASFGTGMASDAYFMALTIPLLLFGGLNAMVGATFIPMYTQALSEKGEPGGNALTTTVLLWGLALAFLLCLLGFFFAPAAVRWIAPGFKGEAFALTVSLTRIVFPVLFFTLAAVIVSAYLNGRRQYIIPAVTGFPYSIMIIGACLLFPLQIKALAVGTVLAALGQLLIQLPWFFKTYRPSRMPLGDAPKRMLLLALPVLFSACFQEIGYWVDKYLVSFLQTGSVSAISYANRLMGLANGIFVVSLVTVLYPLLSKSAAEGDKKALNHYLQDGIFAVFFICMPISGAFFMFSEDIVRLVFERGAFSGVSTTLTAGVFGFYALGLVSFALRDVFHRVFYALKDTKTPMVGWLLTVSINIALSILLIRPMGAGGVALANTLAGTVGALFLFIGLRRRIGPMDEKRAFFLGLKLLVSAAVSLCAMFLIHSLLKGGILGLAAALGVGGILYFACVLGFNVKQAKTLFFALCRRRKKHRGFGEEHHKNIY